jgi:hypothetical protein
MEFKPEINEEIKSYVYSYSDPDTLENLCVNTFPREAETQ